MCNRVVVPVDFTVTDDTDPNVWHKKLIAAGFDPKSPSIITAEGLLLYLHQEEINALTQNLSNLTCPGSIVVGDVMNHAYYQWELAQPILKFMEENDAPWVFGYRTHGEWKSQWEELDFELEDKSLR